MRNAGVLLYPCRDINLAVNTGENKYMGVGHHRGMMANEHIRVGSNFYERVKKFKRV